MTDFSQEIGGKLFGFHPKKKSDGFPEHIAAVVCRFGHPISSNLMEIHIPGARHLCPENIFHKAELEKLPNSGQYRLTVKTTEAKTIHALGFIS